MKARFLHVADCHLGYRQYNQSERYDDFARAFGYIVDQAIAKEVDFVVLAGDLFQKRAIAALTLQHAMAILERLQKAGIPCIAVEGNHELSYFDDYLGWVQFLQQRKLLQLLDAGFEDGQPALTEHNGKSGAYIDINPELRIYGMKYKGSSTARAIAAYAEAIETKHQTDAPAYTIFIAHTGVEGVLSNETGGLSHRQLAALQPHINYLALGHVHKPFEFDQWIYNPGSPETCSMAEAAWPDRGYYLVEIDTDNPVDSEDPVLHTAKLHANPRRPFVRISVAVDLLESPEALIDQCKDVVKRKARDHASSHKGEERDPVVELRLTGVVPFERSSLQIKELEAIVQDAFDALYVQIRNQTTSAEFAIKQEKGISRPQLERQVVTELLERDARYVDNSQTWTDLILSIKNLALAGAGSDNILHELSEHLTEIDEAEVDMAKVNENKAE